MIETAPDKRANSTTETEAWWAELKSGARWDCVRHSQAGGDGTTRSGYKAEPGALITLAFVSFATWASPWACQRTSR